MAFSQHCRFVATVKLLKDRRRRLYAINKQIKLSRLDIHKTKQAGLFEFFL